MLILALAVFLAAGVAACSDTGADGPAPAASPARPPAEPGTPREPVDVARLDAAVEAFVAEPNRLISLDLVAEIGRQQQVDDSPYLVDLIRMSGSTEVRRAAIETLAAMAGVTAPTDDNAAYVALGSWALDRRPRPGPSYRRFKEAIYGAVDAPFGPLLAGVPDLDTLAGIQWGGVPVGGIVELNDPIRIPPDEARWPVPDEIVFVVDVAGTEVVYPRRVIGRHELANDHVVTAPPATDRAGPGPAGAVAGGSPAGTETGRVPFGMSYCSLCRTAVAFDRRVDGRELTFRTSGLLLDANKLMVDNETGSLWRQATGEAIGGPLTGRRLDLLPVRAVTYAEALAGPQPGGGRVLVDLPEPFILDRETGTLVTYPYLDVAPLADYLAGGRLWFPVVGVAGASDPLAEVVTITLDGAALAVDLDALGPGESAVVDVGGRPIRIDHGPSGPRLSDPATGAALPVGREAWFSWLARHPDTGRWPPR